MTTDKQTPLLADRPFSPQELADWCGGQWGHPPREIHGVMIDSRVIRPGNLYVALPGTTVDGHDFVEKALQAGAAAALVQSEWQPVATDAALPLLRVASTLQALMDIGRSYRQAIAPFMIGVTGSVGKSTVKTWTAALLAKDKSTAATCGNYNTDIGLPLSLLQMERETHFGVFELGISHPGELKPLCHVLEPEAAIITTIGPVHLEFFDSLEAIANEKAELLRNLPASGFAVLDADSPWIDFLQSQTCAQIVTVSQSTKDADYRATDVDVVTGSFTLCGRGVAQARRVCIGAPGAHNVLNALLAVATVRNCGVPWESIEAALPDLPGISMRWESSEWQGVKIINDAYNANPIAMEAAIQTFAQVAIGHRRLLVLGEMRELGPHTKTYHAASGACVATSGCEVLIAVGTAGGWIADAAEQNGFKGRLIRVEDAAGAGRALTSLTVTGDWILLKASRGVHLEKAIERWHQSDQNVTK